METVFVVDEAIVRYSREREDLIGVEGIGKLKGMALGLGKIENKELELVEGCLLVADNVGVNGLLKELVDNFNKLLLQQDLYNCEVHACTFLYRHMFDDLGMKIKMGCEIAGFDENRININMAYAVGNLRQCTQWSNYYEEKQDVGEMTKEEITKIDEKILRYVANVRKPCYIRRSEYTNMKTSHIL